MGGNYNRQSCFAYDPGTNTWAAKTSIPPDGCKGTLSATSYNGLIYTFGGVTNYPTGPMSTVNVYNPNTDIWEFRTNMPTPRYTLRTFLVDGKIYTIGGSQGSGSALSTVEVYDPETDTWERKSNMPFKVSWFTGAVYNNKIYVFGGTPDWVTVGNEVWEYDPSLDTITTSVERELITPKDFALYQNYPNPFNPSTVISYQLAVGSQVTLKVFDVLGNEVAALVNEEKPAGTYEVEFNASNLTSGVYFYTLQAGEFLMTKKFVLLK
jgi:N-acetylneuraminic acid mutarotase